MQAIVYLILGFIPPLMAGPFAGIVLINILKRRKRWYQIPFWVLLVGLNLLVMYWVASSSGEWDPISSLSTFIFTPVASILTIPVMRSAWSKPDLPNGVASVGKRGYTIGLVLIPALQIGLFAALILFGPQLCKVDLVVCRGL